jgi:FkbM family methyltransferase
MPHQRQNRDDDRNLLRLISWVVPIDGCCIDVGAHLGTFTKRMADVAPNGRHIAYEPLPDFADRLRSSLPQVSVREVALSDEVGETTFSYLPSRPAESSLGEVDGARVLRVRVSKLDDDLPPGFVPSLIKIDAEDHELAVLLGADRILAEHHPTLALEHGVGPNTHELLAFLDRHGYRVFDMDGRGPFDADSMANARRWNWVAS